MKTIMKTSLKASLIAVAIASFSSGSLAAGLGQINVFSGLGQPLRAEIQVSATPQELQSLTARIGSAESFRAANLAYSSSASSVRVNVDPRGSRPVIRLSSVRPINDPFVELLVELNWSSGQIAREYTFLLDPVDLTAPKPVAARVDPPLAAPAMRTPPSPVAREAAQEAARTTTTPERYTVRRGDTLLNIAASTAPQGANLDQMLVALFRANPGAFDGANINRLRAGAILSVPSADRVQSVNVGEARREVLAQASDFEAYRRRLAGAVASRTGEPEVPAEQASGGRIVPKVEEARPAPDTGDKVRVSRSDKAGEGDAGVRLQALEEELASRDKALQDANARLAQLENSIRDLQKLLEMKSATLGQAQQQASGMSSGQEAPAPAGPAPAPAAAAQSVTEAAPAVAEKSPEPSSSAPSPAAPPVLAQAAPDGAAARPDVTTEPSPAPKPVVKKADPVPTPPPEEPGFIDSLLGDPSMLAAGGGIAALLLAFAGLKLRQRRPASEAAAEGAEGVTERLPDNRAVFGETGGQSVDTGSSVLMTDFSQSGLSAIDTDEGVDPVAEADVYMAYGRDAQAEEILQDAVRADPERVAIYLKLLEIYAQRKSVKQFETVATDLYARTGGRGADWERAAVMGRKLDPENPLYGGQNAAVESGAAAPSTEMPAAAQLAAVVAAAGVAAAATDAKATANVETEADVTEPDAPVESLSALDFTSSTPVEPSLSQFKDTWTLPGELGQFAKSGDGGVESAEAADLTAADSGTAEFLPSVDAIDFDLGLDAAAVQQPVSGLADAVGAAGENSTVSPAPSIGMADEGLVFDLDIGDLDTPPPATSVDSAASLSTAAISETVLEDVGSATASSFDFDLEDIGVEIDVPSAPDMNATMLDVASTAFEPETTALGLDFDAAGEGAEQAGAEMLDLQSTIIAPEVPGFAPDATSLDLEFDLPDIDSASGVPAAADLKATVIAPASAGLTMDVPALDLERTSFDSSLLDFDFDLETPAALATAAPNLDLTSIDLNLEAYDGSAGSAGDASPHPAAPTAANYDEIETKLELARAYEEMGDKEGALELLDEVLREGGAQQQTSAREMIARLG